MRTFRQCIDDGSTLSSSADDTFLNIDTAILDTIKAAAMIAGEEVNQRPIQTFSCEAQDAVTHEVRRATVSFSVHFQ